jgi:hypothetical protein
MVSNNKDNTMTRTPEARMVVTWQWNNGFNLIDARPATGSEATQYMLANAGKNRETPVKLTEKVG